MVFLGGSFAFNDNTFTATSHIIRALLRIRTLPHENTASASRVDLSVGILTGSCRRLRRSASSHRIASQLIAFISSLTGPPPPPPPPSRRRTRAPRRVSRRRRRRRGPRASSAPRSAPSRPGARPSPPGPSPRVDAPLPEHQIGRFVSQEASITFFPSRSSGEGAPAK